MFYWLLYVLAVVNLICILHIGFYSIGANSYDILRLKQEYKNKIKWAKRKYNYVPKPKLVSVIIAAHNEEKDIRRTLDSVLANTYQNIEVIVVNDGSKDQTLEVTRSYMRRVKQNHTLRIWSYFSKDGYAKPKKIRRVTIHRNMTRMKVISQKNQGKAAALNNAIKNQAKGQLVMTLDADSLLHPLAIEKAVSYFKNHKVIGVAANVRIMESRSVLGKLQRFEHMIGYRSKKAFNLTNSEFIIGGVASTYRRSILKKVKFYDNDTMTEDIGLSLKIISMIGNKQKRIVYASDVVAVTEGVHNFNDLLNQRYRWKMGNLQNLFKYRDLIAKNQSYMYSRMLTLYRLPMAVLSELMLLIEPILLAYIIYMSVHFHTPSIAIGAYTTITLYTLSVLWPDEHISTKEKIKMSFTSLWIYIAFFIMDIVQLYAIIKTIRFHEQLYNRSKNLSTWVSPTRASQSANA